MYQLNLGGTNLVKKVILSLLMLLAAIAPGQTFAAEDTVHIMEGSFVYDFSRMVQSQDYYVGDGTVNISLRSTQCNSNYTMSVVLYHSNGTRIGSKSVNECGGSVSWSGMSGGYYYFELWKRDDGRYVKGSGTIG